jgi:hypothetical protein
MERDDLVENDEQAEHKDCVTAATLRRVFLQIERKRHARQVAALWFLLGLSLAANVSLWWAR